jgi:L-ribulose-5-phosphate 4-epimerase
MSYTELKEKSWKANMGLVEAGLVLLTWGNASAVDRAAGVMAIKPSGVAYSKLRPEDMVVLALDDGRVVEGKYRPSSDTATHLHLYQRWAGIGGVAHTHSLHATSFCQAAKELPCLGTTHADHFHGTVPVTRLLNDEELAGDYELNTGRLIVECFEQNGLDPLHMPAVLLAGHAPFTWGATVEKALENSVVLEFTARMALNTWSLTPGAPALPKAMLDKHFFRKHGPGAYYGQK